MTEKQARYFIEVFEKKNIALAAEELYVSRPVISRAISELERKFGTNLFLRSNTGVEPTYAAVMIYRMLVEMSASYNAVAASIKELEKNVVNRILRFGVTPTNADRVYDVLLRSFAEEYPDIKLSIIEKPYRESLNLLLNDDADIIFTPLQTLDSCFEIMDGFHAQFSLGISAASPLAAKSVVSISDIFDVTFGSLDAPMPLEELLNSSFSSFGKTPNIAVRSSSLRLLQKMVQDGKIAVVLPDDMMNHWEGVSVVPLDFIRVSTHRLVWNKFSIHNSAFDDLISYAKQVFH